MMDELILPHNCKYDLERGVWVCGGVELVIGPAEDEYDEYYEEEEEEYEDCGSDLIPAEFCTEDYEDLCESDLIPAEFCGD
jgi:hypothetical protein